MPSVKILRNLGVEDARVLELDPQVAREGKVLSVDQGQADELIRCGLCEMVEQPKAAPHERRQ